MAAKRSLFLSSIFSRSVSSMETLEAYISHPSVRMPYPKEQTLALTKSQLLRDPPKAFSGYSDNRLDLSIWKEAICNSIIYARNFEREISKDVKDDNEDEGHPAAGYQFNLFANIIKNLLSLAKEEDLDILKNLHFIGNPPVDSTWQLMDEPVVGVRGRFSGTLVKSKKPLRPFFNPDEVDILENSLGWTDKELDEAAKRRILLCLHKSTVQQISPPTPLSSFNFPYVHTLVFIDDLRIDEDQLIQRVVLSLHGLLLEQARAKISPTGGLGGLGILPEPECAQAIITDGQCFTYIWYQLNTADFRNLSSGPRNFLVIRQPGNLYRRIINTTEKFKQSRSSRRTVHRSDYEKLKQNRMHRANQRSRQVDDFNDEILSTLLTMFLWN